MAVFLTFWSSHMNNQRKCQLGDDAINYFTFLCCWLQRTMVVTPSSHCGIHTWGGNVQFHSCAHAAIVEEDTTMYLEQGSAAFNALFVISHHSTALSGEPFPRSQNSVILDRWRCIRVICPKRQHFYKRYDSSHNCNGTFAISCLCSSLQNAPSCIK